MAALCLGKKKIKIIIIKRKSRDHNAYLSNQGGDKQPDIQHFVYTSASLTSSQTKSTHLSTYLLSFVELRDENGIKN